MGRIYGFSKPHPMPEDRQEGADFNAKRGLRIVEDFFERLIPLDPFGRLPSQLFRIRYGLRVNLVIGHDRLTFH
jgi:hypothetical protein